MPAYHDSNEMMNAEERFKFAVPGIEYPISMHSSLVACTRYVFGVGYDALLEPLISCISNPNDGLMVISAPGVVKLNIALHGCSSNGASPSIERLAERLSSATNQTVSTFCIIDTSGYNDLTRILNALETARAIESNVVSEGDFMCVMGCGRTTYGGQMCSTGCLGPYSDFE